MDSDWSEIHRGGSLPHAHLLKSYLEENGIKAVILNQQDSSYLSLGDIIIYVSKSHLVKAKWLLDNF